MNTTLVAANQGIELVVTTSDQYQAWLEKQPAATQNWLRQTQFSGSGLSLIPGAEGKIAQAIFVHEDLNHYFSCGDLAKQLPAEQFLLVAEQQYHKAIAFSWAVGSYSFDPYRENAARQALLAIDDHALVEEAIMHARAISLVRDLINTPPMDMMPEHLAESMQTLADEFNANFSQVVGDQLLTENYPTIHAVGRASIHPPRLLDLSWGRQSDPKITLVGKGVCFDSGGLDIKASAGMRNMKKDMGGAAHVLGLAQLIMAKKLPVRLRVIIPAVENAVSSNALRPGDVIVTRKGISVEIHNTDAEGRLVLCDALAEAENDSPELLIDFATLTGAMRIALGTELPGFFSTNQQIAAQVTAAGTQVTDPVWQMPLYTPYKDYLKSEVADMTNCSVMPQGGSIAAALYLQEFIDEGTDWLHFDIMGWNNRALSGRPLGGEAFGVRAVFAYLQNRYSTK
ncbi:MAG: leucyl aminopeptidase family protein [Pseudomonadales bacterium]|nr:leucyl aminopeptidase family protein [Pseudomonadales bacterium]NRA16249.1 leucyl aminopeptidase family protein [Oceanospirillaceae bacterium]